MFEFDDLILKEWYIDVEGKIELYIENWCKIQEAIQYSIEVLPIQESIGINAQYCNWINLATPLLRSMLTRLADVGRPVSVIRYYQGSAGPSHILKNGILFERSNLSPPIAQRRDTKKYNDIQNILPIVFKTFSLKELKDKHTE
jgi:hypothetical protein